MKKWIDAYGDPRKPQVDMVDWIERIPFYETRNYVQRVMENLAVYRQRLEPRPAADRVANTAICAIRPNTDEPNAFSKPGPASMDGELRDLFVTAADGLRLYARDYGPEPRTALPCRVPAGPGAELRLTSTNSPLALSRDAARPRRVLALDYRGRGRSEWDRDLAQLRRPGRARRYPAGPDGGGNRRGGFRRHLARRPDHHGARRLRPALLRGAVLNDVGPVIEREGLRRIRGYVGKLPQPRTFAEADGDHARALDAASSPATPRPSGRPRRGRRGRSGTGSSVLTYDPNLTKPLEALDLDGPLPDLWPLFEALKPIPVMAIRGANSDLLTAETFQRMQAIHPDLTPVTVPDQGHAPELEGDLVQEIRAFIERVEARPSRRP